MAPGKPITNFLKVNHLGLIGSYFNFVRAKEFDFAEKISSSSSEVCT